VAAIPHSWFFHGRAAVQLAQHSTSRQGDHGHHADHHDFTLAAADAGDPGDFWRGIIGVDASGADWPGHGLCDALDADSSGNGRLFYQFADGPGFCHVF